MRHRRVSTKDIECMYANEDIECKSVCVPMCLGADVCACLPGGAKRLARISQQEGRCQRLLPQYRYNVCVNQQAGPCVNGSCFLSIGVLYMHIVRPRTHCSAPTPSLSRTRCMCRVFIFEAPGSSPLRGNHVTCVRVCVCAHRHTHVYILFSQH